MNCPHQSPGPNGTYHCRLAGLIVAGRVCARCIADWPSGQPPRFVHETTILRDLTAMHGPPRFGLGDLVHIFAGPFARLFGRRHCCACGRRRRRLNAWLSIPLLLRRQR
jgi:hypothetical protein